MKTLPLAFAAALVVASVPSLADRSMEASGAAQALMSDNPTNFFESAASANLFEIESSKLALTKS